MNLIKWSVAVFMGSFIAIGCAITPLTTTSSLKFTASSGSHLTGLSTQPVLNNLIHSASTTLPSNASVTVDEFHLYIDNVLFEPVGQITTYPSYIGPYQIDLVSAGALGVFSIPDTSTLPDGQYDTMVFTMATTTTLIPGNTTNTTPMSSYISGSYTPSGSTTAIPFEIWGDSTEDFDLSGPNPFVIDSTTGTSSLIVDFKMGSIETYIGSVIEAYIAQNGGNQNPILINPSTDQSATTQLIGDLKTMTDVGADVDGDGQLSETEDVD